LQRQKYCGLPSVIELLNKIDLAFLKNCLSGRADLSVLGENRISIKQRRDGLRGESTTFTTPQGCSNAYLDSYFSRDVRVFNSLPDAVKTNFV
jgi:hypothetical protein